MTIGERIQVARKKKGMKQSELAEILGVAVITIGQYERDKREPRLDQLRAIADALNVPLSFLTEEPHKIEIPLDDYTTRLPSDKELERMSSVEKEYYHLRLLADTLPDELKKKLTDSYDKLNKLGKVEAVRRSLELTKLSQYTEPDPNNKPIVITIVPTTTTTDPVVNPDAPIDTSGDDHT